MPDGNMRSYLVNFLSIQYLRPSGMGMKSMHFRHIIDPQRRQWWRRFLMLNLFPQSGQKGTSASFTQETTDLSIAKNTGKILFC